MNTRAAALQVVRRVHKDAAFSHLAIKAEFDKHPEYTDKDKAFITELAFGALKAEGTLDWILAHAIDRSLDKIDPDVLDILRIGVYQLWFMDGVADYAAVNESVEAGPIKARGYINGVLRALQRSKDNIEWPGKEDEPEAYLSLKYYHPMWLVRMWLSGFGFEDTELLLSANNSAPPSIFRINPLRASVEDILRQLGEKGIEAEKCHYAVDSIRLKGRPSAMAGLIDRLIKEGLVQPQGEAASVACMLLEPARGETIADVCAAPGSKTTQIAGLMQNEGKIIAIEINGSRARLIRESCERMGVSIADVVVGDARDLDGIFDGQADRILVDAPCSGLGNLNKRPDIRWRKTEDDIKELVSLQRQLLTAAAEKVRPGGVLVYSTCTISRAENEGNAAWFISAFKDFMEDQAPLELNIEEARTDIGYQFLPSKHGTEGFYMVRFKKQA